VAASETLFLDIALPEPHRLAYRRWGNSNAKETIVCAHGLSRNGHDFNFLAEALAADGFQVIAADMPGRGTSVPFTNPEHYHNQTYVNDVKALLDHLGLKKVHWIGTSMGGIMGMMIEGQYPGTIKSLVLNDIGCILPAAGLAIIARYLQGAKPTDEAGLKQWIRDNWKSFDVPDDERYWKHLFQHYIVKNSAGEVKLAYDPAIMTPLAPFFQQPLRDADYSPICTFVSHVPTLLVRGGKSELLTEDVAKKTRALWKPETPFEEYVIPTAGHAPILMRDEEIEKIREWMARQTSQARFSTTDRTTGFVR